MRVALLVAMLVLFAGDANAQFFCNGCGCKGGSGWRHISTNRCVGCEPVRSQRCGSPLTQKCRFEGQAHLALIKRNCPSDVIDEPLVTGPRPLK